MNDPGEQEKQTEVSPSKSGHHADSWMVSKSESCFAIQQKADVNTQEVLDNVRKVAKSTYFYFFGMLSKNDQIVDETRLDADASIGLASPFLGKVMRQQDIRYKLAGTRAIYVINELKKVYQLRTVLTLTRNRIVTSSIISISLSCDTT